MAEQVHRVWQTTVGDIELVEYADGDIAIQKIDSLKGFVLSPKQVRKFITIAKLIKSESDRLDWKAGNNCAGDSFSSVLIPKTTNRMHSAIGTSGFGSLNQN